MTTRDLTAKQFNAALKRHNFEIQPFSLFGYIQDNVTGYHISRFNAGNRRRDQLAYLLQERARWQAKRCK